MHMSLRDIGVIINKVKLPLIRYKVTAYSRSTSLPEDYHNGYTIGYKYGVTDWRIQPRLY
jgi:hypothetical protein